MESGGVWWSRVRRVGVWWSLVESGGVGWSRVESGGVWWSLVESGGVWWSRVESGGINIIIILQNKIVSQILLILVTVRTGNGKPILKVGK